LDRKLKDFTRITAIDGLVSDFMYLLRKKEMGNRFFPVPKGGKIE
jgi:hypothetical protein